MFRNSRALFRTDNDFSGVVSTSPNSIQLMLMRHAEQAFERSFSNVVLHCRRKIIEEADRTFFAQDGPLNR